MSNNKPRHGEPITNVKKDELTGRFSGVPTRQMQAFLDDLASDSDGNTNNTALIVSLKGFFGSRLADLEQRVKANTARLLSGVMAKLAELHGRINALEGVMFNTDVLNNLIFVGRSTAIRVAPYHGFNRVMIENNGGSAILNSDRLYEISTGVSPVSLVSLMSESVLTYRFGQGASVELTTAFPSTPQPNSSMNCGFSNREEGFFFVYFGETFSILILSGAKASIYDLTITTGAAGAEVATVTVDNIGYPVNLTSSSIPENANEIADELNNVVPNWLFSANGAVVTGIKTALLGADTMAFSSATAVAGWAETRAFDLGSFSIIPRIAWHNNPEDFDPSLLNKYKVDFSSDTQKFYVFLSGEWELVHTVYTSNDSDKPFVSDPIFTLGWNVSNFGNTTPLTVLGGGGAAFVHGENKPLQDPISCVHTQLAVGTALTNIISLKSRLVINNAFNNADLIAQRVSISIDNAKGGLIVIAVNEPIDTATQRLFFSYVDEPNSIAEISFDAAVPVDPTPVGVISKLVPGNNEETEINLEELGIKLRPGDVLNIFAGVLQNPASDITATVTWQEDA